LSDRWASATYRNVREKDQVTKGCPQGSILSPTLWKTLISDFLRKFSLEGAEAIAFADDLSIVCSSASLEGILGSIQNSLRMISDWCEDRKLTISMSKTQVMPLAPLQIDYPIP